jgi:hypothetical protein
VRGGDEEIRTTDLMQDTTAPIVAMLRDVDFRGDVDVRVEESSLA